MSYGQMSFWANVFLGKHLLGKRLMGKCPSGQMSFWANVFWTDVFWANVSEQMSLGKCRMGKCRVTPHYVCNRKKSSRPLSKHMHAKINARLFCGDYGVCRSGGGVKLKKMKRWRIYC
jgi:hypothetical protein